MTQLLQELCVIYKNQLNRPYPFAKGRRVFESGGMCFAHRCFALILGFGVLIGSSSANLHAQSKHAANSAFPSYTGRVMAGYQGWFRCPGDGSGRGWVHWGARGQFSEDSYCTIDFIPETGEYEKTYDADFLLADGSSLKVFSSYDASTVDKHFEWMAEYGVDGVFMQRFFANATDRATDNDPLKMVRNVMQASQHQQRAFAIMYDLSGLRPGEDDCTALIDDWKRLVDDLNITNQGDAQTYLYHNGKPLVAIWGVGFPDRPYDIHDIKIDEFIEFLKNDPEYGGCTVLLGVPNNFRTLDIDCIADPYLHTVIESADMVMPWMVLRFSSVLHAEIQRYSVHIQKDLEWCNERSLEYVPVVYPGMSWRNLSIFEGREHQIAGAVPRLEGYHYWMLISTAINSGANKLYVAMYDEVDEGTAILKCTDNTPVSDRWKFETFEGAGSDYYLRLTGSAGEELRKKINGE